MIKTRRVKARDCMNDDMPALEIDPDGELDQAWSQDGERLQPLTIGNVAEL